MLRWVDYRLRYIDPAPRVTLRTRGFSDRVPSDARPALEAFISLSERGGDLNPYQSKTLQLNDTSGKTSRVRTDLLWADWGINHAHLTLEPIAEGARYSTRSNWILFFFIRGSEIFLIDVLPHDNGIFESFDLLEKLLTDWPDLTGTRIQNIIGISKPTSTDPSSIRDLRRGGVNQAFEINGNFYFSPGLGVTSASTSGRVTMVRDNIYQWGKILWKSIHDKNSPFYKKAIEQGISEPIFNIHFDERGLVLVCDKLGFRFPTSTDGDIRTHLQYNLLPEWAAEKLSEYKRAP